MVGIKYVLSGANERANLKGTFPTYLLGVGLIVTCSLIASTVANIAGETGDNTAPGIVKTGFELAGLQVGTSFNGSTGGDYSVGGDPDNPYLNVDNIDNGDGTYTEVVSGSNRNQGTTKITRDEAGNLLKEEHYDENGKLTSQVTYNSDGTYTNNVYTEKPVELNDFIFGDVMGNLATQENGEHLIVSYAGTNDKGDDLFYFNDTIGDTKAIATVEYDKQGRVKEITRIDHDGVKQTESKGIHTNIKYEDDGTVSIETKDEGKNINQAMNKYDIVTNDNGEVKEVTYSEYEVKSGPFNDEYKTVSTTTYSSAN